MAEYGQHASGFAARRRGALLAAIVALVVTQSLAAFHHAELAPHLHAFDCGECLLFAGSASAAPAVALPAVVIPRECTADARPTVPLSHLRTLRSVRPRAPPLIRA